MMTNYARLADTLVVETIEIPEGKTPFDLFADPVAELFVEAPAHVERRWQYIDGQWVEPEPIPEPGPKPRHITVGAFFDRFGDQKYAILSSADSGVKALVTDSTVRQYIDLDHPGLATGLQMLVDAGFQIDPSAVLHAPIEPIERP